MDPNRPPKQQTSPWVYIGCGCGILAGLLIAGVVGLTIVGYRKGKDFEEAFKDPVKREARTREILHYDKLPEGYYPLGAFSVPMAMEMAMLTDHEPKPDEGKNGASSFHSHGFVYMSFRSWIRRHRGELKDYIEGKGKRPDWLGKSDADLENREIVGRGTFDLNGIPVDYAASRGDMRVNGHPSRGLATFLLIECPGDRRQHLGIWFGPDPAPTEPAGSPALQGTNADPAAMKEFLGHFRFCTD